MGEAPKPYEMLKGPSGTCQSSLPSSVKAVSPASWKNV